MVKKLIKIIIMKHCNKSKRVVAVLRLVHFTVKFCGLQATWSICCMYQRKWMGSKKAHTEIYWLYSKVPQFFIFIFFT